jgi:hypothetical protein
MRIISDFKDYYDCIQRIDEDRSLIYLRKKFSKELVFNNFVLPFEKSARYYPISATQYIIGFCGNIYPLLIIRNIRKDGEIKYICCYNINDIQKYVEQHPSKYNVPNTLINFFNKVNEQKTKFSHIFIENKSPIFVAHIRYWDKIVFVFNEELQQYHFDKIFNTYLAYQELSMYLGNIAFSEKPLPKIPDKILLESKGFDKYSFRKPKSK